jgi:hypothetical protein
MMTLDDSWTIPIARLNEAVCTNGLMSMPELGAPEAADGSIG